MYCMSVLQGCVSVSRVKSKQLSQTRKEQKLIIFVTREATLEDGSGVGTSLAVSTSYPYALIVPSLDGGDQIAVLISACSITSSAQGQLVHSSVQETSVTCNEDIATLSCGQ